MTAPLGRSNTPVVPRAFEARLQAQWPDFRRIEWDATYCRWRFFFTSAAGRECSILYCWDRNPRTGGPPETDPFTGLRPFRDLDEQAQAEILFHGERTSLTNRHDGAGTWKSAIVRHVRAQQAAHAARRRQQAEDYATVLAEVDLRRPWVKDHPAPKKRKGRRTRVR